jgi:hypothetical protein
MKRHLLVQFLPISLASEQQTELSDQSRHGSHLPIRAVSIAELRLDSLPVATLASPLGLRSLPTHSARNAIMGLALVARRAGR